MPLNIKDQATTELARQLAARTGETLTGAVAQALSERLVRTRARESRKPAVERILAAAWRLPRLDDRSAEEILGYDERGLPA